MNLNKNDIFFKNGNNNNNISRTYLKNEMNIDFIKKDDD